MTSDTKTKQLLKLLIAAAWIDGTIQPEERDYLNQMIATNALGDDSEIKMYLSEATPIDPQQCYQWLEEYLGQNPSKEDYQNLLESLSALIYVDDNVETEEAKLLTYLQNLEPGSQSQKSLFDNLFKGIQELYRKAM
ncbi:TerB family tellurite resistance protein [Gloeocapsa sp. PCC 73106]|uniref:tellurite resistance TerB family protein n=1 Tax=Gloeocapsa sp. PCC 73106 TaxID=102232 RepID=UPI0002ABFA94|nr:TerB family tellurite resistance protein [Gloeocapsa sp. PCC 73106]ELR97682.1 hypothetical protein GLO73106DRAFT_00014950 [Gloeocapsa sp. PCC 73106]